MHLEMTAHPQASRAFVDKRVARSNLDANSTAPLRDVWYYATPSHRLKRGKLMPKTLMGEPIVFGRDTDGKAFALRDICPHRGIPLRFGRFDGCEIECCYHGWRFDAVGACTAIPAIVDAQQPDLSKVRVRSYPVQEVQGGIWIFLGDELDRAPPVPVLPELDGHTPKMVKTMMFEGSIDHAVIGLVDPAHVTFVHQSWFWRSAKSIRDKVKAFESTPWGFTMTRHSPSSNSFAYKLLGGNLETEIVFRLPGVRYEHITAGKHVMCHMTTLTPVGDLLTEINHSIYWTMPWLTPFRPLFRPFVDNFLDQDREVIARQQLGLQHKPPLMLLGDPDVPARWYLRLKNEFVKAKTEGRAFDNPIKSRTLTWRS
jgi:phenylpropionate dioxygenase-like ring-hydroxylating dioxygenase large terminal subunit